MLGSRTKRDQIRQGFERAGRSASAAWAPHFFRNRRRRRIRPEDAQHRFGPAKHERPVRIARRVALPRVTARQGNDGFRLTAIGDCRSLTMSSTASKPRQHRQRLAGAGLGIVYLLVAGAGGLGISNLAAFSDPQLVGSVAQAVGATVAIGFVGWLIASRLPGNRTVWIVRVAAVVNGLTALFSQYLVHTVLVVPGSSPGTEWVAWVGSVLSSLIYPGIVVLIMLFFPDGRLPSPRWRWLVWALVAMTALINVVAIIDPLPIQSPGVPPVHNPTGLRMFKGLEAGPIGWVTFLGVIPLVLLGVASLVLRLRRARGETKQQIRWVVYALGVTIILNVLLTLSPLFFPASPQGR